MEAHAYAADVSDEAVRDGGGERQGEKQRVYRRKRRGCGGGYLCKDIDIAETRLRPGEKLYENLDNAKGSMIFIERDKPKEAWRIEEKLALLSGALATGDDSAVLGIDCVCKKRRRFFLIGKRGVDIPWGIEQIII